MNSHVNACNVVWASQEDNSLPHGLHGSTKGNLIDLFYWANDLGELMQSLPVEGGSSQRQGIACFKVLKQAGNTFYLGTETIGRCG